MGKKDTDISSIVFLSAATGVGSVLAYKAYKKVKEGKGGKKNAEKN